MLLIFLSAATRSEFSVVSDWCYRMHNLKHAPSSFLMLINPHLEFEYMLGCMMYDEPRKGLVSKMSIANLSVETILHPDPIGCPFDIHLVQIFKLRCPITDLLFDYVRNIRLCVFVWTWLCASRFSAHWCPSKSSFEFHVGQV